MKKAGYIVAFGLFGLLLALLVHALVELIALQVVFDNPGQFSDTVWWQEWHMIRDAVSTVLLFLGLLGGLIAGWHWWEPYGRKSGCFGLRT